MILYEWRLLHNIAHNLYQYMSLMSDVEIAPLSSLSLRK